MASEKPPIFGRIQRGGEVVLHVLENVQQAIITPRMQAPLAPGTCVYTDAYAMYSRVTQWGYVHKRVCHSKGAYARDEDGDGVYEVYANTTEGVWSL